MGKVSEPIQISVTGWYWTGTTTNSKTGNVPTLTVGKDRAESLDSCGNCPLLKRNAPDGKARCYAQHGTPAIAHGSMIRARARNPESDRYTFKRAMRDAARSARMVRFGAAGDPAAIPHNTLRSWFKTVRGLGMDVVGYTHQWANPANTWLKDHFMASVDDPSQVDAVADQDWRVATVAPADFTSGTTPAGRRIVLCPAMAAERKGRKVTCNQCRMCDPQKGGPVIAFIDHGPSSRSK